jgi:hypothetical protein
MRSLLLRASITCSSSSEISWFLKILPSPILTFMSSRIDARARRAAPSGLSRTVMTPSGPQGRIANVPLWVWVSTCP